MFLIISAVVRDHVTIKLGRGCYDKFFLTHSVAAADSAPALAGLASVKKGPR